MDDPNCYAITYFQYWESGCFFFGKDFVVNKGIGWETYTLVSLNISNTTFIKG